MKIRTAATIARRPVAASTRRGQPPADVSPAATTPPVDLADDFSDCDVVDALTSAASFVARQVQVALRFLLTRDEARGAVAEVLASADRRRLASPGAVGAIAVLADHARTGDEAAMARTIVDARRQFGTGELLAASAALIAAWNEQIAGSLALDPADVADLLYDAWR